MQDAIVSLSPEDRELIKGLRKSIEGLRVPEVLVSCREAARILGYAYGYVSFLVRTGKLVRRTIGHSTGILLEDVMKYKNRREAKEPRQVQG